ncbi:3,4-dihydroxy-2-butanone-4-phosphate synthase [Novosphingobium sp. P6W]|uniref:3,4-dihydroxy-2-butanone-4-phosphate synthase n=1 Tax=Novosphingobium sp. P6W TaxID=1609758 RepID=UPI0005C2B950|nr:3,4-dihydroxy-2-butanone-4-phosphate synthase [Novosphingobium sp. P6W]AXB76003.1 3,4-dihydroxy-2-butanone-4-phosphate synthase [Novosphingobium sp. P6W]KIS31201.1 3,4-dihydroxy-2-butanone 4-phosphate synthase [Novosphingobium sp. P6W]
MTTSTLANARHAFLATAEEIIDEARNGRMFILVDDEDRENEGDLVIPAQMATPEKINFMARYGKGLICLAMTEGRVRDLGLGLMAPHKDPKDTTRYGTAFTTSIEARVGVTTGISAADRARTIAVAIDGSKGSDEIVTPGHVFPLIAREGGVLVRAGHTEAAVDVARLAGLNPSGVICEIMNDDGTMSRLDDLVAFSQLHGLKVGTIRDLIAYRRRHDNLVEKTAEVRFVSRWGGEWKAITYRNRATDTEQIALVKGPIDPDRPTLVRMHVISTLADIFAGENAGAGVLQRAMETIAQEGSGVVIAINRARNDRFTMALKAQAGTLSPADMDELRDYGVGAMILSDLGIEKMTLLTNTHRTPVALAGYGLSIEGERAVKPAG